MLEIQSRVLVLSDIVWSIKGIAAISGGSTFNAILLRRIIFPTAEKVCLRKNAISLHSPYTQGMTLAKSHVAVDGWLVDRLMLSLACCYFTSKQQSGVADVLHTRKTNGTGKAA
jgi:hypothetical protein